MINLSNLWVRKVGFTVLLGMFCCPAQSAQRESLYFLSATFNGGGQWPARLFRIDPAQGNISLVREIVPGCETVIADYDQRILAVVSPPLNPNTVDAVFMDSPTQVSRQSISYDVTKLLPEGIFEFDVPNKGRVVAFALGQMWKPTNPQPASQLSGVLLGSHDNTIIDIPWSSFPGIRSSGYVGGELPIENQYVPEVRGNPLHVLIDDPKGMNTDIPRPAYLNSGDAADSYRLFAVNNEIAGLIPFIPADTSVLDIRVGSTAAWSRVQLPMSVTRPRAFGYWIAAIAAEPRNQNVSKTERKTEYSVEEFRNLRSSPGQDRRQSERIGTRGSVEDFFSASQSYYPGTLVLVDSRTRKVFTVSTGTGDSEVVLVTDQAVYYRADSSLYLAPFAAGKLGQGTLIVESPEIAQAHWAFLSESQDSQ